MKVYQLNKGDCLMLQDQSCIIAAISRSKSPKNGTYKYHFIGHDSENEKYECLVMSNDIVNVVNVEGDKIYQVISENKWIK